MATRRHCACFCHHAGRGDLGDARQRLRRTVDEVALKQVAKEVAFRVTEDSNNVPPRVDCDGWMETLVACRECIGHHGQLTAPAPKYKPPTKWEPDTQGDGGEG